MNRKANGVVVGIVVGMVLLGILSYFGMQMIKTPTPSTIIPTPAANKGDIDRSGAADEEDRLLIKGHLDCLKTQPCWNTTVGKTKDGDNPLYVFDLDLNIDGFISQADMDLVK